MDTATAARANAILDQISSVIKQIEDTSNKTYSTATKHVEQVTNLKSKIIQTDATHWSHCKNEIAQYTESTKSQLEQANKYSQHSQSKLQGLEKLNESCISTNEELTQRSQISQRLTEDSQQLRQSIQADRKRITSRERSLAQRSSRLSKSMRGERQVIHKFQHMLGLQVSVAEDRTLEFKFTCIDPRNENTAFKVLVASSDDSSSFEPLECKPIVTEFEELSSGLRSGDIGLTTFVRSMRAAFVKHAQMKYSGNR